MKRALRRGALAAVGAAFLASCGGEDSRARFEAPARIRATSLLEPPRIGVGQVATLEVAVVTPPDHRVAPYRPPSKVPGFWLLGIESLEPEKRGARWVHRSRVRLRAREVGHFTWPGGTIAVTAPDGSAHAAQLAEYPLQVTSILPEFPDRLVPFGLPELPDQPKARGLLAPFAAGALTAFACVALVWATRRRLGRASPAKTPAPGEGRGDPAWRVAGRGLSEALDLAAPDPRRAAALGAGALREFMQRRFGGDVTAHTTEELARARPPFGATSRWLPFLAILRQLDAVHFRPGGADAAAAERVRRALEEARAFVAEATPPEALE